MRDTKLDEFKHIGVSPKASRQTAIVLERSDDRPHTRYRSLNGHFSLRPET
jgi:hypothetical protein